MRLSSLALVSLMYASSVAYAQVTIAQLETNLLGPYQLEFFFDQQVTASSGEITLSSGKLAYQRPDRFRLDYISPEKVVIVSDGEQVWVYDMILNQVVISGAENSQVAKGLLAIIARDNLRADFELDINRDEKAQLDWLLLTPFDKEHYQFESCAIGFNDSGIMSEMRLQDTFGNTIQASFSQVATASLDEALFSFSIPDGAEIIRESN